jgi:hypothetical protein
VTCSPRASRLICNIGGPENNGGPGSDGRSDPLNIVADSVVDIVEDKVRDKAEDKVKDFARDKVKDAGERAIKASKLSKLIPESFRLPPGVTKVGGKILDAAGTAMLYYEIGQFGKDIFNAIGLESAGGFAAGAGTGAAIGSIIPGVGTAVGAVVGGVVGHFFEGLNKDNRSYVTSDGETFTDEAADIAMAYENPGTGRYETLENIQDLEFGDDPVWLSMLVNHRRSAMDAYPSQGSWVNERTGNPWDEVAPGYVGAGGRRVVTDQQRQAEGDAGYREGEDDGTGDEGRDLRPGDTSPYVGPRNIEGDEKVWKKSYWRNELDIAEQALEDSIGTRNPITDIETLQQTDEQGISLHREGQNVSKPVIVRNPNYAPPSPQGQVYLK